MTQRPLRIISLLPSATEIVTALGLVDFLIGRSHECDYPPQVTSLPVCTQARLDCQRTSAEIDAEVKSLLRSALSLYDLKLEVIESLKPTHLVTQDQCWVTANEAVSQFGVTPVPYKKFEIDGSLAILHEPFNALFPPRFNTESDRDRSLAQLLLGEVLAGDGQFNFSGQNMTMLEPLSLKTLPFAPNLALSAFVTETLDDYYARLQTVSYQPGFPLLSEAKFKAIKSLEVDWAKTKSLVRNEVYSNCDQVWESTVGLDWSNLDEDDRVSEDGQEELFQLRRLYPELNSLSDGTLYNWFDSYQNNCNFIKGWNPYREDSFLFYLLGLLVVDRSLDDYEIRAVGEVVGFELLQGKTFNDALQTGKIGWNYDRSLSQLTWRIYCIMEFLKQNRESQFQGSPVTTFTDVVTAFRKPGIRAIFP